MKLTRRGFLVGGCATVAASAVADAARTVGMHEPNLAVFLSDIHCNGKYAGRWVQHQHPILKRYVAEILAMRPLPANVVVFGDFSASCGWKEDFALAREILQPLMDAGITLTCGMGNHDKRRNFLTVFPEYADRLLVKDRIVSKIEFPRCDFIMLDSLREKEGDGGNFVDGKVDGEQLAWLRAEIAAGARFAFIPTGSFTVFVTGGSQGAHMVNCIASEALAMMKQEIGARGSAATRPLYVIHQTGANDEGPVMATYAHVALPSRVHAFEREMANAFASADIVVARAGASTCFELAACGKPAILIPLPTAMRNHQHFNADAFVARGAADEGIQADLTARQLCRYLMDKYDHPERLAGMAEKMKTLATPDAAAKVADLVESVKGV